MFGFAALKSSTIFLKKLPSGPVNAFQTVSVAFPDGGWKAPVPPLLPAPALAPPPAAWLEDSAEPELLPAPADSDGADDAPVEVPLEAPPPAGEAALPPELLPPLHAATSTVVAAITSSRRGQGASDMFRSPRKRPAYVGLPEGWPTPRADRACCRAVLITEACHPHCVRALAATSLQRSGARPLAGRTPNVRTLSRGAGRIGASPEVWLTWPLAPWPLAPWPLASPPSRCSSRSSPRWPCLRPSPRVAASGPGLTRTRSGP